MITYSEKFKNGLNLVFPKGHVIHLLVNQDSYSVGQYLHYSIRPTTISYREILKAETLEELQLKATIMKNLEYLEKEWEKEVHHWTQSLARP